jgi:hypothetical protein
MVHIRRLLSTTLLTLAALSTIVAVANGEMMIIKLDDGKVVTYDTSKIVSITYSRSGSSMTGVWLSVGKGDCAGRDVSNSRGGVPDASKCNASFTGFTAVCWRDVCTYKNIPPESCKGGGNPGDMYRCETSAP